MLDINLAIIVKRKSIFFGKWSDWWLHKHLFAELFRTQIIRKHLGLNKAFAFLIKIFLKNNRVYPLMAPVLCWWGIDTSIYNCVIRTLPIKLLWVKVSHLSFWMISNLTDASFILFANKALRRGLGNLDVMVRFCVSFGFSLIPECNLTFVKLTPFWLDPVF